MGGTELMVQAMAVVLMHGLCAGLYTWPLAHRPHYRLRLALCLAAGAVLGYAYWRSGLAAAHLQWWQLVVAFLYVAAMVLLLCDQPLFGSLYCATWMMMTQQFFIQVYNAWFTWMSVHYGQAPLPWLCVVLFAGAGSFLVYIFVVRGMAEEGRFQVGPRQTISALLLFVVFEFLTASIVVDFRIVSVRGSWVVILMCEFYCLTILFLQNALFKKSAIQHDLDALDLLWHRQKEQYLLARKNIALINRRCHDLKVQIYALRDMADSGERRRYLDEIDDSIGIYDSIVKTGSEVLDTILTEKSLLCRDRDIHIQCVADGSRMGFLDPADTYAIFGNALDNAIEAVQQFADKDNRRAGACEAAVPHHQHHQPPGQPAGVPGRSARHHQDRRRLPWLWSAGGAAHCEKVRRPPDRQHRKRLLRPQDPLSSPPEQRMILCGVIGRTVRDPRNSGVFFLCAKHTK